MKPPSLEDQIASVSREVTLRERVYPRMIEQGRMTKGKAEHELACMKAVAATLMTLRAQQPLSAPLSDVLLALAVPIAGIAGAFAACLPLLFL